MDLLMQHLFNGVVASSVYMLIAVGITLVFGLTRLINFAHGQFLVLAVFVALDLITAGVPFVFAALAAVVTAGAIGWLSERLLFRFTMDNPYNGLIIGLGLLLVLEAAAFKIWGGFQVSVPAALDGGAALGDTYFAWNRVLVLVMAGLVTAGLFLLLARTKLGAQLRAAHENPVAASHVGVNVGRMVTVAFVAGSALAGLGGVFYGTLQPVGAFDGGHLILKGFAVALLGGLGNVSGLAKASVLYGIGETLVAGYGRAEYVPFFTYGVIIIVLLVRPGGLFEKHPPGDSTFARSSRGVAHVRRHSRVETLLGGAAFVLLPIVIFEAVGTSRLQSLVLLSVLYAIQVYALAYVYETTGVLSIAQGGLMAVGAYSAGVIAVHLGLGFWWALLVAVPLTVAAGALLGLVVSRCTGHYLLLVTLAFSALVTQVTLTAIDLTNGDNGLILPERLPVIGPITFTDLRSQFYLVLLVTLLAAFGLRMVKPTRFGRQLAGVRENESLARSIGLRVGRAKVGAFALSGAVSAVGGVLYLYTQTVIVPTSFDAIFSIEIVIILILGGISLAGPLVASMVYVLLPELLRLDPVDQQLLFGVLLIMIILLLPRGLVPALITGYSTLRSRLTRTGHPAAAAGSSRPAAGGADARPSSDLVREEIS
ncbi:ABC transporter permease [Acrocarpospora pleiomorpha]|uniref:ABC transporter permease n=1 Tax=Acrocarpospora pleiomorpha TaxID=90975 RepID=A0A5M3XZ54_9ACTN|nr:ABC transporter permease [Acrocarpospora pleiomorpha]GES26196.1 ABC transporter permease [Acrocarpospora pleiomorpha]